MILVLVVLVFFIPGYTSMVVRKCCNMSSQFINAKCVEHALVSSKFFVILETYNESLTVTYGVPHCTRRFNRITSVKSEIIELNRTRLETITTDDAKACLDVVDGKLIKFSCTWSSPRGLSYVLATAPTSWIIHFYVRITLMVLSVLSLLRLVQKFKKMPPTIHNRAVLASCTTLAGGYIFLIIGILLLYHSSEIPSICPMAGTLLQLFVIAHFFWLHVICYDLWRTFGNEFFVESKTSSRFRMYSCYVWGCTLFIVIATLSAEFVPFVPYQYKPNFEEYNCFFRSQVSKFIYFQSFVWLILLSNLLMFILILRNLKRHARDTKRLNRDKLRFRLYVRLSLFMGMSWFIFLAPFTLILQLASDLHGVLNFFIFRGSFSNTSCEPTSTKTDTECISTSCPESKTATTSHSEVEAVSKV